MSRRWKWSLIGIALTFGIEILWIALVPRDVLNTPVFELVLLAVCVLVPGPFILYGWQTADEAINQSHKDAFIAGGTIGGFVSLVSLVALSILSEHGGVELPFNLGPHELFLMLMGVLYSLAATTIFYMLFLVFWWHSKR